MAQGMAGLEIQTGKTPGAVVRRTPAPRPAVVGALILGLFVVQMVFLALVSMAIWQDLIADPKHVDANGQPDPIPDANNAAAHHPDIEGAPLGNLFLNEQTIVSFWLACLFFSFSYMIFLYQRAFKDHVTIVKRRFRKWEDEGVQLK